jgi:putative transcriptional regulator
VKTKVKALRTAAGMTQQQLAERVHVSARTVISIEKEQYSPSLMLAYRMAEVFGVTVEELCYLRENREMEDRKYEDLS